MDNSTPEFKDFKEIDERVVDAGETGLKIASIKTLKSVTHSIVNTRLGVQALQGAVRHVGEQIRNLNESVKTAASSSENLTTAIKNATIAGVIVAIIALGWDIFKTLYLHL